MLVVNNLGVSRTVFELRRLIGQISFLEHTRLIQRLCQGSDSVQICQ